MVGWEAQIEKGREALLKLKDIWTSENVSVV
jgi:hypothetical protein